MSTSRPERGKRRSRHDGGAATERQRHRADLSRLVPRPIVAGVVLATLLLGSLAPVAVAQGGEGSSRFATALIAREQAIEARLSAAAADRAVARLANGVSGVADRRLASQTLEALRGPDGEVVASVCVLRSHGIADVPFGLGASVSSCADDKFLRMAMNAPNGRVVRSTSLGDDGSATLMLAAPIRTEVGRGSAALAAEVDVAALFRHINPAGADTASSMLVDLDTGSVVAHSGTPVPHDGVEQLRADELEPIVGGILADDQATAESLAERGLGAATVALWGSDVGSRLGVVEVGPASEYSSSGVSFVMIGLIITIIAGFTILVLIIASRFRKETESGSRLQYLYDEAREDSFFDSLTGLGNHRSFQAKLASQLEDAMRRNAPLSLALFDMDDLGVVNHSEGHKAGDDLLVGVAETMEQMGGPGVGAYRIGGDEFALIMPGSDIAEAVDTVSRILHFCRRPPTGIRPTSFSAGISGAPFFTRDQEHLYRQARAALDWVKGHGRGDVEVFDPGRDHAPDHPVEQARGAVQEVVAGKMLSPVYQPIVDLANGRVIGFEGLIRPDPKGPLPDTAQLFAAAAASGRTVELDLACIEVVLAGARAISPDRLLTLNLSPRTLEVKDFDPAWLLEGLMRNGISPSRVILELTERDAIGDLRRLQQTVAQLQEYGLRLAADDVGAGNSGLQLLSKVRFDIVKIDLSLVQDGAREKGPRAVLTSLRDLAISQHSAIVAEGVETPEQLQVIRELQIGAGQGYLLGRPGVSVQATFVDLRRLAIDPASPIVAPSSTPALSGLASPGVEGEAGPFAFPTTLDTNPGAV